MAGFKGKAIYNPSGKAEEYSYWACNFYVGCSNGCTYCYLKKGRGAKVLGGNIPTLKKCFKDEDDAIKVFQKELYQNINELQKHGLFFSFTTDPMIFETKRSTIRAVRICNKLRIPVKILTKESGYIYLFSCTNDFEVDKSIIAVGVTLTGHDEMEPNASTNSQRIKMLGSAKKLGYKTFASIEPIIDFDCSYAMFILSLKYCDLYKIGLESGKKYSKDKAQRFISNVIQMAVAGNTKVYFKDSLLKCAAYERSSLKHECCVGRDYDIFQ